MFHLTIAKAEERLGLYDYQVMRIEGIIKARAEHLDASDVKLLRDVSIQLQTARHDLNNIVTKVKENTNLLERLVEIK